ncbi:MAG: LacI family DNA-binding transcriptional regulator [Oscillospiraceae bacterium]|nr:LacI family DNA-binding transcriptional regulator [Oscillospiraceae bacterium]
MPSKKVTMQDIADACGLSRNTVSKVFNGRGAVPPATQQRILQKAEELGYRQAYKSVPKQMTSTDYSKSIALLTQRMPENYHFGTIFLPYFTQTLSRFGYTLMMYEISGEETERRVLPAHLNLAQTAGILCMELFDRQYQDMICSLGIPALFMDMFANAGTVPPKCDVLYMENVASTVSLTKHVIAQGARRLGFVGDINHCNSFYERWMGFRAALEESGLALERSLCILADDREPYHDPEWLGSKLREMPVMPDAFVCANDFLAIHMLAALKRLSLSVPNDVMLTGFDGLPQSGMTDPAITTAEIPSIDIARLAADILAGRIQNPERPCRITYVQTTPVWRASTHRT